MMHIGFTGTRQGTSLQQRDGIRWALFALSDTFTFHHGVCVGADAEAHMLVKTWRPRAKLYGHPGPEGPYRAKGLEFDMLYADKAYLERNRDIVDHSNLVIATPKEYSEPKSKRGGGTWYTIRYARKQGKPLTVIYPDGQIEEENV